MEKINLYIIKRNKSNGNFHYVYETTLKNGVRTPVSYSSILKSAARFTKEEAMKIVIDNPIDTYTIIEETRTYREIVFEFNLKEK